MRCYLLFASFIAHFAAAVMHALFYRDGVFQSMAPWKASVDEATAAAIRGDGAGEPADR